MSPARNTLSSDSREARRMRAWELHQQGWSQRKIAAELGVTQGAVSQWLKRAHEGSGVNELRSRLAPGRRSTLTEEQLRQIPQFIAQGAQAFGFQGDEWTTTRVANILKQQFGVSYHPAHVSRLLRKYCPNWREWKNV